MDRGEKVALARELSDELHARFGEAIVATGVHGSVARCDDGELSDIDLAVIVAEPAPLGSAARLHGAVVVDMTVVTREQLLREAALIDRRWPLRADRYVNTLPLHDPGDFFRELRATHDHTVAEAGTEPFMRAAGDNLADAIAWAYKARAALGINDCFSTAAVAEAAVSTALTIGCLARYAFKNLAHALFVASRLPGVPPGLDAPFRAALGNGLSAEAAVKSIEDAVEVLLSDALKREVPFTAETLGDFL